MFRVGLSHDLWAPDGTTSWGDIGLSELDAAGVSWEFLPADDGALTAAQVDGYDAVLFAAPAVTAETVSGDRPPQLFARFGVGLDVFDPEPLPADHPLLGMDNVVLSPHALAWTDEMARGNGSSAMAAILAIRAGQQPVYLANPAVMNHDRFLHRTREGDR